MITTILRTATNEQLAAARHFLADHLHISFLDTTNLIAVAYVCQHFEQGAYTGWDGFIEMRAADRR